jgi:hypothetical protein
MSPADKQKAPTAEADALSFAASGQSPAPPIL